MKILVTAFGPFDGRSQNASSLALAELKRDFPRINTRVLPVDSVLGPARLLRALRQLRPDALLMLGEAAGSAAIRLETTAWNELDFSIPDAAGRQPRGTRIHEGASESLEATLPWNTILAQLQSDGHSVSLSASAGRYLCNQVMFEALRWIGKHHPACVAGFIHLPLADDYPTGRASHALASVMQTLKHPSSRSR
jgi:pyroglutamyl-peptidase